MLIDDTAARALPYEFGAWRSGIGGAANIFCRSEKPIPPSFVARDERALSVERPVLPNA